MLGANRAPTARLAGWGVLHVDCGLTGSPGRAGSTCGAPVSRGSTLRQGAGGHGAVVQAMSNQLLGHRLTVRLGAIALYRRSQAARARQRVSLGGSSNQATDSRAPNSSTPVKGPGPGPCRCPAEQSNAQSRQSLFLSFCALPSNVTVLLA